MPSATWYRTISTLVSIFLLTLLSTTAHAQIRLDLPAQPLGQSLTAVGTLGHLNVLFDPSVVDGLQAPALKAELSVDDALKRLLSGSNLHAVHVDANTIRVVNEASRSKPLSWNDKRLSMEAASEHQSSAEKNSIEGLRLAETSPPESALDGSPENQVNDSFRDGEKSPTAQLAEVTITGTLIRDSQPITPIITMTHADLVSQGYTRLDDAIAQLPQSFGAGVAQQSNGFTGAGTGAVNNQTFASGVNLRGLGPGTTLVLLNGQRLPLSATGTSVDISGIPVSAIDRVEVLTDGASAIYGSDAIGGVVNIITQKHFSGVEAGARAESVADGKAPNYGGYVLGGHDWGSGNVVLDYDYEQDNPLLARNRSWSTGAPDPTDLLPEDRTQSAYAMLRQELGPKMAASLSTIFSDRTFQDNQSEPTLGEGVASSSGSTKQVSVSGKLSYAIASDWAATLVGQYGNEHDDVFTGYTARPTLNADHRYMYSVRGAELQADGGLVEIPGGTVRAALGTEFRRETFNYPKSASRRVTSAFAELSIPVFGEANRLPLVDSLQLDFAGRNDHYNDFGSSTNPKVALKWGIDRALALHASYNTSFKAPTFFEETLPTSGYITAVSDPSSASGKRNALIVDGGNARLEPERSRQVNIGLTYSPQFARGLEIEVSHFDITYTNRILRLITQGYFTNVVTNASQLGSLVNLNPSTSDVTSTLATIPSNQLFDLIGPYTPAAIRAIADVGYVNASASRTKGFDIDLRYVMQASIGRISLDWENSILTSYDEQITDSLPQFEVLDTIFNPTRFRSKMNIGWARNRWSSNIRINYVSSYTNAQDKSCGAAGCGVSSWTTADFSMAYSTENNLSQWYRGIRLALNLTNVANRSPPQVRITGNNNLFYDPTNASPLGRAFAATISKRW